MRARNISTDDPEWYGFTGLPFHPLRPKPEEVRIVEIAHSLANLCRFTGHTSKFYSIAQHSYHVAQIVPPEDALWALLHDASEAYLADFAKPLKEQRGFGRPYRAAERRLMQAICVRFGLPAEQPPSVTWADQAVLATEWRDLMGNVPLRKPFGAKPLHWRIVPMPARMAQEAFYETFQLINRRERHLRQGAGEKGKRA